MRIVMKIVVVIAALTATLFGLEKVYDFGLRHNLNLKIAAAGMTNSNARLLIHGPCEPLWMISPDQIDSITGIPSYNLALSHSDFADNYLLLYEYLRHNQAPAMMYLYVTPESFDRNYNTFNSYRFAPYLNDSVVAAVVKENDPAYSRWTWFPFMKYAYYGTQVTFPVIQGYKHYFTGRRLPYYPSGFEPPAKRVWGNHAGEFVKLYRDNVIFSWDSLRVKYLVRTIRLAKTRGIAVILYESPVLEEALAFQPNRGEIIARIDSLAKAEGVDYVRFEGLPFARERKYFISTLNFNMSGLRLFNDTLGKYMRSCIGRPNEKR
jgi:hypothetical protein